MRSQLVIHKTLITTCSALHCFKNLELPMQTVKMNVFDQTGPIFSLSLTFIYALTMKYHYITSTTPQRPTRLHPKVLCKNFSLSPLKRFISTCLFTPFTIKLGSMYSIIRRFRTKISAFQHLRRCKITFVDLPNVICPH